MPRGEPRSGAGRKPKVSDKPRVFIQIVGCDAMP